MKTFIMSICLIFLFSCDAEPYQMMRYEAYRQDQAIRQYLAQSGRLLEEENPAGVHILTDTAGSTPISADTSCTERSEK